MNIKDKILLGIIGLITISVLWFSREIFFYKYDSEYYENWYYHSQWNIPNSVRGISDGELYKFVGYAIVKGENPFDINYEVPPFGKSLYGLAEILFGNPYWVSVFFYLASGYLVYKLLFLLSKRRTPSLLGVALFISTPFIATQAKETMLDLPLTFLFLAQAYFFVKYLYKTNKIYLVFSGIFLGLASATKPAVYTPLVALLGISFVVYKAKNLVHAFLYPIGIVSGYILGYFTYFLRHPNPIPWLRLHRKIYDFYLGGGVGEFDHFSQLKGVLTGSIGDWSLVIFVGLFATLFVLVKRFQKNNTQLTYLSLLGIVFLLINSLIPFFDRYLMPVVAFFVVLAAYVFRKSKLMNMALIALNIPILITTISYNNPKGNMEPVSKYISTRAYRELYRSITLEDRNQIEEDDFINTIESFLSQLGTRDVLVEFEEPEVEGDIARAKYKLTYDTRYGPLINERDFIFRKEYDQWKLEWKWDYLWKRFEPGYKLKIEKGTIPISRVEDRLGELLAQRGQGYEVYVIPRVMLDWTWHLDQLSQITGESTITIDERVKRTVPDHFPRFVGYLDPRLSYDVVKDSNIPGVTFEETSYIKAVQGKLETEKDFGLFKKLLEDNKDLLNVGAGIYIIKEKGNIVDEILSSKEHESKVLTY